MKIFKTTMVALAVAAATQSVAQTSASLEEIVITAQRKSETLQDAAIAINAASGSRLSDLGVVNAEGLNKIAPSLAVLSGGGANTAYFIRGAGNFTNNGYTNPAVAFNIDGVYIGRPSSTISSFLDLNRVEVLKGPQGTLYGRNSTGGAVNVIPNAPVIDETTATVKLGVGNYSAKDFTVIANVGLTDNSALRLAATVNEHDGYFSDGTADADDFAFRASYLVEPTDALRIRVSTDYATQKGNGAGTQIDGYHSFRPFSADLPVPNWPFNEVPANISDDYTGLHSPEVLAYLRDNVAGAPGFIPFDGFIYPKRDDSYFGVNAEIVYDMDWAELTVIPAYRKSELDNQFNGPPFKAAINEDTAKQISLEARLSGSTENLEWILGAFYFTENVKGVNSFNQFSTVSHNAWENDVESSSLFARGTYSLTDELRLVAGIRYTDDSWDMKSTQSATAAVCFEDPVGRPPSCSHLPSLPVGLTLADTLGALDPALFPTGSPLNADGSITPGGRPYGPLNIFAPTQFGPGAILAITPGATDESGGGPETTYRLAVEYDVADDSMLYASLETGFRSGGVNLAAGRTFYEPEFIDAYTIGSKNRFLDNALEVNLEFFYWEYSDQQLAGLGIDGNGNNAFYTRNVGDSTIKGLEVDFQYAVAENTLIRGSAQFLDAVFTDYTFDQVDLSDAGIDPPNFLTPVNGCQNTLGIYVGGNLVPYDPALDVEGATRGFTVDCSGKDALNAPDLTLTFGIQQTVQIGDVTLVGNLDARYRDERELGFNFVPNGRADSALTSDASVTVFYEDLTVNVYVRNLTDEAVASTYQIGSGNVAGSAYEPPRTYGVRLSYDF